MYPSIQTLMRIDGVTQEIARQVRVIMDGPRTVEGRTRMERIDAIIGTHGVEYIPAGRGAQSPAITYCNTGDTYGVTVLRVNERFRVGCWGDWVERGHYE